jgi:hypothetical protein
MHQLRKRVRVQAGGNPDPSVAIIDSQSVKPVQKESIRSCGVQAAARSTSTLA